MLEKLFSKRPEIPEEVQGIFIRKDLERFIHTQGFSRAEARKKAYLLKELGLTQKNHVPEDK